MSNGSAVVEAPTTFTLIGNLGRFDNRSVLVQDREVSRFTTSTR